MVGPRKNVHGSSHFHLLLLALLLALVPLLVLGERTSAQRASMMPAQATSGTGE